MGVLHYDFKGMLYDEWELDRVYTTGARTICEADVARYCSLSGDYSLLYTNALYAENTVYGRPIAPGGLTFIIANGLDCQTLWVDGSYIGLLDQQMRFLRPVYVGDTICLTMTPPPSGCPKSRAAASSPTASACSISGTRWSWTGPGSS